MHRPNGESFVETSDSPMRVLVVDDDPMMGTTLRLALEDDYAVTVCSSAEDAMKLLERERFALVLCDLMMPRVSGMDLFRWFKEREPDAADHMLFMTGGAYTEMAANFLRDEAKHHIEKPFRVDQLMKRIDGLVGRSPL